MSFFILFHDGGVFVVIIIPFRCCKEIKYHQIFLFWHISWSVLIFHFIIYRHYYTYLMKHLFNYIHLSKFLVITNLSTLTIPAHIIFYRKLLPTWFISSILYRSHMCCNNLSQIEIYHTERTENKATKYCSAYLIIVPLKVKNQTDAWILAFGLDLKTVLMNLPVRVVKWCISSFRIFKFQLKFFWELSLEGRQEYLYVNSFITALENV